MSKYGTCKWAYQIQEMWIVPRAGLDYSHPHTRSPAPERVTLPDQYTCQWLEQFGPLPSAIARMNGGFRVRASDCDACPHYEPASNWGVGVKT
jgi:hypothetical protein